MEKTITNKICPNWLKISWKFVIRFFPLETYKDIEPKYFEKSDTPSEKISPNVTAWLKCEQDTPLH